MELANKSSGNNLLVIVTQSLYQKENSTKRFVAIVGKISPLVPTIPSHESKNCVTVTSKQNGLITVEPYEELFWKHEWLISSGIHHVNVAQLFKVIFPNLTRHPVKCHGKEVVAADDDHPYLMTGIDITHGYILGIVEADKDNTNDKNVRDIYTRNKHIPDKRLAWIGATD